APLGVRSRVELTPLVGGAHLEELLRDQGPRAQSGGAAGRRVGARLPLWLPSQRTAHSTHR
ncbi:hypothetical protein, partial [Streptomyces sp. NPDC051098]|uniref:hypothetical protein n=1 Tax=Streptomyces sp. NPDC051098 TaxID=3155411 RepID=UPI00342E3CB5